MREKNNFLVNFIIRAILGMAIIFALNRYLEYKEIALQVGWNAVSFLTSGFLGLPGVAMLYGILAIPVL